MLLNLFVPNTPFLYPLKTPEKLTVMKKRAFTKFHKRSLEKGFSGNYGNNSNKKQAAVRRWSSKSKLNIIFFEARTDCPVETMLR